MVLGKNYPLQLQGNKFECGRCSLIFVNQSNFSKLYFHKYLKTKKLLNMMLVYRKIQEIEVVGGVIFSETCLSDFKVVTLYNIQRPAMHLIIQWNLRDI